VCSIPRAKPTRQVGDVYAANQRSPFDLDRELDASEAANHQVRSCIDRLLDDLEPDLAQSARQLINRLALSTSIHLLRIAQCSLFGQYRTVKPLDLP
jgi:hypothetical protein